MISRRPAGENTKHFGSGKYLLFHFLNKLLRDLCTINNEVIDSARRFDINKHFIGVFGELILRIWKSTIVNSVMYIR